MSSRRQTLLTTTEAARIASVAPSTIKRWSDQGLIPFSRTAGGHRRFERSDVERMLQGQQACVTTENPLSSAWVQRLVGARRHEIDGGLLEARGRLGSWANVADELALALVEVGKQWERGGLTIAEEHVASNALTRGLARVGDMLPTRLDGPRCLLACVSKDEHTIGLSLAELCLREAGWTPLWLGRRTPIDEVVRLVRSGQVSMVALTASAVMDDADGLRDTADVVGSACKDLGCQLILGGAGAWPEPPAFGARLRSFSAFQQHLARLSTSNLDWRIQ